MSEKDTILVVLDQDSIIRTNIKRIKSSELIILSSDFLEALIVMSPFFFLGSIGAK